MEAACEAGSAPQVGELAGKVGEQRLVADAVIETSDFLVFDGLVKRDFGKRRLDFQRTVPRTPVRAVEAAALGTGVGEGRVDHPEIRHAEYELVHADTRKQAALAAHPL